MEEAASLSLALLNYLSLNEKSSLSDLKPHNRCKNLWGETKYLGGSCCCAAQCAGKCLGVVSLGRLRGSHLRGNTCGS